MVDLAPLPFIKPYPESRATLDGLFVGTNTSRALQRANVAWQYQAVSNEEAHERHHSSRYTDDEKRWLVKADEEERRRGKGFMDRLKKRWDEQYPEKRNRSKQNLRDNAVRF